jgi:hypothetical protein
MSGSGMLPPALTPKQFGEFAGISKSAVDRFMKKCPQAVVHDFSGRNRVLRNYAEAFTTNTIHELVPKKIQWEGR